MNAKTLTAQGVEMRLMSPGGYVAGRSLQEDLDMSEQEYEELHNEFVALKVKLKVAQGSILALKNAIAEMSKLITELVEEEK